MTEPKALYALIAPTGQLTGNGQLRETIQERRNRQGDDIVFWYLPPNLVERLQLADPSKEAVISDQLSSINWLKLRFGGEINQVPISSIDSLRDLAMELPPEYNSRDISESS